MLFSKKIAPTTYELCSALLLLRKQATLWTSVISEDLVSFQTSSKSWLGFAWPQLLSLWTSARCSSESNLSKEKTT
jgi:hypothetical protein